MSERVLVFPAGLTSGWPDGLSVGDPTAFFQEVFGQKKAFFMDRRLAESDEGHLQVIPYCLLWRTNLLFRYRRTTSSGESRLHGLYSLGVGGHVNPPDGEDDLLSSYREACRRELQEEVGHCPENASFGPATVLGFILDRSTAVGRVHLGIVHSVRLAAHTELRLAEDGMAEGAFLGREDIWRERSSYENWSRLLIEKFLLPETT